jgi:hypothetical protein
MFCFPNICLKYIKVESTQWVAHTGKQRKKRKPLGKIGCCISYTITNLTWWFWEMRCPREKPGVHAKKIGLDFSLSFLPPVSVSHTTSASSPHLWIMFIFSNNLRILESCIHKLWACFCSIFDRICKLKIYFDISKFSSAMILNLLS